MPGVTTRAWAAVVLSLRVRHQHGGGVAAAPQRAALPACGYDMRAAE